MNIEETRPALKLYGRRKGRPLHVRKSRLMQEFLPQLRIELPEKNPMSPQSFFGKETPVWLEIGFGGGEHLAAQAKLHPEISIIGCEPFENGVASLCDHLDREQTKNVRIFDNDARLLLDTLKDASLDRCFVLFADPWPKKRHIERRFIGPENLDRLARVLKPGAVLRLVSDHPNLVAWMQECLSRRSDFENIYASIAPPQDWVQTRYQEKALIAGRQPFFMDYRKK